MEIGLRNLDCWIKIVKGTSEIPNRPLLGTGGEADINVF